MRPRDATRGSSSWSGLHLLNQLRASEEVLLPFFWRTAQVQAVVRMPRVRWTCRNF